MKQLAKLLSPYSSNIKTPSSNDIEMITEKIQKQKVDVLDNKIFESKDGSVRPKIVQSWLRSQRNGLNYQIYNYPPMLDASQFSQVLKEKHFFLNTAQKYITSIESLLSNAGIILTDERGVILKLSSSLETHNLFKLILAPGAIWNEETIGTCAHGLCILFKHPIQLCGPEHFCRIFNNISCSSAPIFNDEGNLAGTLTISSPSVYDQNSHTLGLAMTLADLIQKEYQLAKKEEVFQIAFSKANDAIFVVDKKGIISDVNLSAQEIFKSIRKDLVGAPIYEILDNKNIINTILETGNSLSNKNLEIKKLSKSFLCSIQSTRSHDKKHGCIISLKLIDNIKEKKQKASGLSARYTFEDIVGDSKEFVQTKKMAKRFAHFDSNILLVGESGTGKDLLAQAIHNENRSDGPYVAINCAAIPGNLIESELFGYESGAFTGAERGGKQGKIELANGGTLFLDEIGDMPIELQAVLLRVLEDGKVMRLGGSEYIPVDFRLVAATNKNLLDLAKKNQFREDLYYRIAAFQIRIPSLIKRRADIIQLIEYFLNNYSTTHHIKKPTISNEARYILLNYNWPGNVRQLQNSIFYATCMCFESETNPVIYPEHLPEDVLGYDKTPVHDKTKENQLLTLADHVETHENLSVKNMEEIIIKRVLNDTSKTEDAAKILGISKSTLYRKMKEYGIKEKRFNIE